MRLGFVMMFNCYSQIFEHSHNLPAVWCCTIITVQQTLKWMGNSCWTCSKTPIHASSLRWIKILLIEIKWAWTASSCLHLATQQLKLGGIKRCTTAVSLAGTMLRYLNYQVFWIIRIWMSQLTLCSYKVITKSKKFKLSVHNKWNYFTKCIYLSSFPRQPSKYDQKNNFGKHHESYVSEILGDLG